MNDHVKPTQEELQKQLQETTEKLDKPETTPEEEKTEEKPAEEKTETETTPDDTTEETDTDDTVEGDEEEAEEEKTGEKPAEVKEDVNKKLTESTKEAQKLYQDNKKITDALHEANNISEPTDEELKTEYPEWEEMSDTEKRLAKKAFINDKKMSILEQAAAETKKAEEWDSKVDTWIENPKTLAAIPELEGKQDSFKTYAKDKLRRNVSLDILYKAFLHEYRASKPSNKGKTIETGTGGANSKPKPVDDKITLEQANQLMRTNYAKYKELLLAGKIKTEIS